MSEKKEGSLSRVSQPLEELGQQRCFSQARRRDQGQESATALNAVVERTESFPMRFAEVQVTRIRGDPEWLLTQSIVFQKHSRSLSGHAEISKPKPEHPRIQ